MRTNGRWLSPEKEQQRLKLHKQGKTDREIADLTGVTIGAIYSWRANRGLKVHRKTVKKRKSCHPYMFEHKTGVHMRKALTPDECDIMRGFLRLLITVHNKNKKIGVTEFMKEYRHFLNGYYNARNVANE